MEFEWDEAKAQSNLEDHKIAFEDAKLLFDDPNHLDDLDDRLDYGEDRYYSIGMVNGVVLFVAYTWRGDVCRIISAREATRKERRKYAQN